MYVSDALLQRYLIGDLSDYEKSEIENKLKSDLSLPAQLVKIEHNLLWENATKLLNAENSKQFESYYLNSKINLEKYQVTISVKKYIDQYAKTWVNVDFPEYLYLLGELREDEKQKYEENLSFNNELKNTVAAAESF